MANHTSVLASKPKVFFYLSAVFVNAFVDLGHKIIIQNTIFKIYDGSQQVILTAIINGLILLPYILFFIPAGRVSDRYPKHKVMRATSWSVVMLTVMISIFYFLGWFWPAFAITFLLAIQSAFYFPAKYSYLKNFFGKENLANANGLSQTVAIVAILMGTLIFSIFFEYIYSPVLVDKSMIIQAIAPLGIVLFVFAVLELFAVYCLPDVDRQLATQPAIAQSGIDHTSALSTVVTQKLILTAVIGQAMFWSVGQVMLAAFPAFMKESLLVLNTVVIQGIVAASGIGIALGAAIAGKVSKGYIEMSFIPLGALGLFWGLTALPLLTNPWLMAANFLFIGVMGGLFIVPLNALVQFHCGVNELGRVLAASSFFQNVAMFSFLLLTVTFSFLGISSQQLLILIAVVALLGGFYTVLRLSHSLVRYFLLLIKHKFIGIDVEGLQQIPDKSAALLIGRLQHFSDLFLLQIACPRPVVFILDKNTYNIIGPGFKKIATVLQADKAEEYLQLVRLEAENNSIICPVVDNEAELDKLSQQLADPLVSPDLKKLEWHITGRPNSGKLTVNFTY